MKKRLIFLLILLSSTFYINAQRAYIQKDKIEIGEQITLTLEIGTALKDKVEFPVFENFIVPGIEIVKSFDLEEDKANKVFRKQYLITSFEDSLFLLPPFVFKSQTGKTYQTNPLRLRVYPFTPDSAYIRKIDTTQMLPMAELKPPVAAPVTFKEILFRFGWILIVLLILIGGYYWYKRLLKRKKEKTPPLQIETVEQKVPAHITAIRKLDQIKKEQRHLQDDVDPFYTSVSRIIREYLEERFLIPAMESVTSDIIKDFTAAGDFAQIDLLNQRLEALLSLSDRVKFAQNKPDIQENELSLEYAYAFIDATKETETESQYNSENQ